MLLPQLRKKKSARARLFSLVAASALLAAVTQTGTRVAAFPLPSPKPGSSAAVTPSPQSNSLPLDSTLTFVLDDAVSSGSSKADEIVRAHLKNALALDGHVLAPAGTPARIRILDAAPAQNPDIYGFVDIYFEPLTLPDGRTLPIRAPSAHLSVNPSSGHQATVGIENTIGDIFLPGVLFHAMRKGRNFTLSPGAEIRARTQATLTLVRNGTIAITTPAPLIFDEATPHSSFSGAALATPNPAMQPMMRSAPIEKSTPTPLP